MLRTSIPASFPRLALLLPLASLIVLAPVAGCGNPTPPPPPAAFDRPESVSFFCWNTVLGEVADLSNCTADRPEARDDDLGRPADRTYELHALVAQTGTGEIAAVQVTGDDQDNRPRIIDSDVRIPGYTFVGVGEVPATVVTPQRTPQFTYVVSRGSNTVHVIDTRSFRGGLGASVTELDVGLPPQSRPSAMVLTPAEDALIVALPESGQLARIAIDGANLARAELLDLATDVPPPVALTAPPPDYRYTCPSNTTLLDAPLVAPREPVSPLGATPRPWALEVDPRTNQVLVADRNFPLIHLVDLAAFAELPPLSVSVPTRGLALTPYVPATVGAEVPTERYLYAIDELDRTVLVVDVSDPERASYGAVLPVNVAEPVDRLDLPGPARVLEVVSPNYGDDRSNAFCVDASAASPSELRGVFLTVATLDGLIRFFDVHDLDTTCRGTGCALVEADSADALVAIRRHRPRIGSFVDEAVKADPAPTWDTASGVRLEVRPGQDVGSASSQTLPVLQPLASDACAPPLGSIFATRGGAPLICTVTDPWAASAQIFTVAYDGVLPSSATTGGNFDEVEPVLASRTDLCAAGVLGREDVPATGDLAGYDGDVVALTGNLPASVTESPDLSLRGRCDALVSATVAGGVAPILLPILRASTAEPGSAATYTGRLVVGDPINRPGVSLAQVRECFPELVEYEVRASGAFVVSSNRTAFRHPVVRGPDGRCRVDPMLEASGLRGRARPGRPYSTPEIAFTVGATASLPTDRPRLTITIGEVPTQLSLDLSVGQTGSSPSLLTGLTYNPVDERLYALEQAQRGLVRIRLRDLTVQNSFQ